MRRRTWWVLLLGGVTGMAGAASSACTSDTGSPDEPTTTTDGAAPFPGSDATAPNDAGTSPNAADAADAADATAPPADSSAPDGGSEVTTFLYHPSWSGVTSASVWGQFGTSTDWTAAFLVLTPDGQGGFTGTATVPVGTISYILLVTGDADSGDAGKKPTSRYVVDPTNSAVTACPAASPTYDPTANNPCSVLTVPSAGASVLHHVRGTVTADGDSPAPGWLVQIERNEGSYHHFFADRTTVGADGTFDLTVAEGSYELFVLNPTYLSVDDADQKPDKVKTYRRVMTDAFPVTDDVDALPPSVSYSGYAAMQPRGDAGSLPTTFMFASAPGGTDLAVYDGTSDTIGDPAYTGPGKGGTATFDGVYDKKKAGDAGVTPGARYFWGVEDTLGVVGYANDAGADAGAALQWTGQSLVFAVVWQ